MTRAEVLVLALLALAVGVRVPGLFTDFWIDEIWSLDIAQQAGSIRELFTAPFARIDNNHFLNTAFLYLMGERDALWQYRLLSFAAGTGAVVLAWRSSARLAGNAGGIAALALFGISFPLVFYSSEARGYAPAVFFALLTFELLDRALSRPSSVWLALSYSTACVMGLASHMTFIHFIGAAGFYSILRVRRAEPSIPRQLGRLVVLHGPTLLALVLLFRFFIRDITIGGAAPTSTPHILLESLSTLLGGPHAGAHALAFSTMVGCAFVSALVMLARRGYDRWLFYVLVVVVMPGLLTAYDLFVSERPQPLMPRYFLIPLAFVLLAISEWIAHAWNQQVARAAMRASLLVGGVAFVALGMARAIRIDRGGYSVAVAGMIDAAPGLPTSVGSADAWRGRRVIDFYRTRTPAPSALIITEDLETAPQWIVVPSSERGVERPTALVIARPGRPSADYALAESWEWRGFSGVTWTLYERGRDFPHPATQASAP